MAKKFMFEFKGIVKKKLPDGKVERVEDLAMSIGETMEEAKSKVEDFVENPVFTGKSTSLSQFW